MLVTLIVCSLASIFFTMYIVGAEKSYDLFLPPPVSHQADLAYDLPDAPDTTYDLSTFSPFCVNGTQLPVASPPRPTGSASWQRQCIRWEEQELDMLLMYLDLISVGLTQSLARDFYLQIRCLSRRHTVTREDGTWDVCFSYDFSEYVGTLLAKYIRRDMKLKPVDDCGCSPSSTKPLTTTPSRQLHLKSKTSSQKTTTHVIKMANNESGTLDSETSTKVFVAKNAPNSYAARVLWLIMAFANSDTFRLYFPLFKRLTSQDVANSNSQKLQTSCCTACLDTRNYYPNVEHGQCIANPFGKYCCHKACKSLARMRVGVSNSIGFCCKNSNPTSCLRT